MSMTDKGYYDHCLNAMFSLRRFGIKLGLDIISALLSGLGDPHKQFKSVHVAGTNGKGSIASALSTILQQAGYRVGLYTSPHLVRFNERICVDNQPISDKEVVRAYEAANAVPRGDREPTFFEFSTAMAFDVFAAQGVEWAVIETGMGGRLDATNVINPEISIISNISLEHQEYLGTSIEQIAGEKGGIIKPDTPVVTGDRQEQALAVFEKIAAERNAPLYCLDRDFKVIPEKDRAFTYQGIGNVWSGMKTGLSGKYQFDNAAVTLAACESLQKRGAALTPENIRQGLARNRWPGRLEVVSTRPFVILDGAHNLSAAYELSDFLKNDMAGRNITMVIGILDDKPRVEMLSALLPLCKKAILTCPKTHRALPAEKLYETAKNLISNIQIIPDVAGALSYAMTHADDDEVICVAGSLYVVGEAKSYLEGKGIPSFLRAD
jgi:dihydrofolate synthase/folylpolyglutamate synthase